MVYEAGFLASASNPVPDITIGTLWLSVENFLDREPVTNTLKYAERIEKIRFAAGVGTDKQVQVSEPEIDPFQTLKAFDPNTCNQIMASLEIVAILLANRSNR